MNKSIYLLVLLSISKAHALTASEIMTKNDEARRVTEFKAQAKLETGASNESPKIKDFTFWRKIQSDGIHNSTLTRFHAPAEVRNEGILIVENSTGKNDVLLYLPNFKKVRRVESQQQSGSFMGSVFSYSDIATPHVSDYQYKTLREELCPGTESAKIKCSVIECSPVNEDIRERTGYSKSIIWVRLDNFMSVKGDYYNLEGKLFKQSEATEIKIVDEKNKKWLAHSLFIRNLINQEYTKLQFTNVKVNSGLADSLFTQQNLQKVN